MSHVRFVLDHFRTVLQWLVVFLVIGALYDPRDFDTSLKFVDVLIVLLDIALRLHKPAQIKTEG